MAFTMVGVQMWGAPVQPESEAHPDVTASTRPNSIRAAERPERNRGTTASPSPLPTPADPGPRGWELPERVWEPLPPLVASNEDWVALQTSPVHDLAPATLVDCPEPSIVRDIDSYRAQVREQWSCVHAAWIPVYEALGWSTVEPAVEFYPGKGSKSECGYLEAPAFYCSAGAGTVYFGGDHQVMAGRWDLSVNEMVNHEYGHHIQSLAGITGAKQRVSGPDDIERRSELQATCWSAMMTYNNRSFDFDQQDYDSWLMRLDTMLVDGVHGSRESLRYWGVRGLYAVTLGDCNTWAVEAQYVS